MKNMLKLLLLSLARIIRDCFLEQKSAVSNCCRNPSSASYSVEWFEASRSCLPKKHLRNLSSSGLRSFVLLEIGTQKPVRKLYDDRNQGGVR